MRIPSRGAGEYGRESQKDEERIFREYPGSRNRLFAFSAFFVVKKSSFTAKNAENAKVSSLKVSPGS
jgi:hypothetical protein